MADLFSPDAGFGVGVDFYGTNYPFVRPSTDLRWLISDLWFAHSDTAAQPPLFVQQLLHFGRPLLLEPPGPETEHPCDIILVDANSDVVCDTRQAESYTGRAFGNRFYIHEWLFLDKVCRVVQHTKLRLTQLEAMRVTETDDLVTTEDLQQRIIEQLSSPVPVLLSPESGELDERAHELIPERITSIQVGTDIITGNVTIVAGYNVQLEKDQSNSRSVISPIPGFASAANTGLNAVESTIVLSAVAGGGSGAFPGCQDTNLGLRSINGVTADASGSFLLGATGCLFVRPPYLLDTPTQLASASLRMGNNCTVCSSCDDYLKVYSIEQGLHDRLARIGDSTAGVVDAHNHTIDRWNDYSNLSLPLYMSLYEKVNADNKILQVEAVYCQPKIMANIPIRLVFTCHTSTGVVPSIIPELSQGSGGGLPVDGMRPWGPVVVSGTWPIFWVSWEALGEGAQINMLFSFDRAAMLHYTTGHPPVFLGGDELTVSLTVTTEDGYPVPAPPHHQFRVDASIRIDEAVAKAARAKPVPLEGWYNYQYNA